MQTENQRVQSPIGEISLPVIPHFALLANFDVRAGGEELFSPDIHRRGHLRL
jgi:hypothetical protein